MKYLRIFEEFDRDGYKSHWTKFNKWLSDKDFELYDGGADLESKFLSVANDDLSVEEKADQITRAKAALSAVGLEDRMDHQPSELSGGQQQRVAIARALVNDPSILFADEPTGNLDSQTGHDVMQLFHNLHDQGQTIILITHENEVAAEAQRTIFIKDGLIESDTTKEKK